MSFVKGIFNVKFIKQSSSFKENILFEKMGITEDREKIKRMGTFNG